MFLFLFFSMLLLCSFFKLKGLFQVKTVQLRRYVFFFWKMPKIWVGRTTVNGEKKGDGLKRKIQELEALDLATTMFFQTRKECS